MARIPEPVLEFFACFLANPDYRGQRNFCVDLLDLEVRRAEHNMFSDSLLFQDVEGYRRDLGYAKRVLDAAREHGWTERDRIDLRFFWLKLLGHRLAIERGLSTGGFDALVHVASRRLKLPKKEVATWFDDVLFEAFIKTKLRTEWDYIGLDFR